MKDLISALGSADQSERIVFARRLLLSQGYKFDASKERARLEQHLQAEVERVVAERRQYLLREDAFPVGDVIQQIMVQSTLFRDRGLSLDTSILPSFAVHQALETMSSQGVLAQQHPTHCDHRTGTRLCGQKLRLRLLSRADASAFHVARLAYKAWSGGEPRRH